jgi:cytochrome c peroxidase
LSRPLLGFAALTGFLFLHGCGSGNNRPYTTQTTGIVRPVGMDSLLADARLWALGERIFFDTNLSEPPGQSCATCHGAEAGWTGPDSGINTASGIYPGAAPGRAGNRKPNSAAYATLAPPLQRLEENGEFVFVGGNFWDGRATGHLLGNPAADQAQGPFLNPLEQNLSAAREVIGKICASDYAGLFMETARALWGIEDICRHPDTSTAFGIVAIALAAFEHSPAVNAFSSKYDLYLAGKAQLSEQEAQGLALYEGKALCSECHPNRPGPDGDPPLFTDFTYDNLGFPRNPDNPFYGMPGEFNPDGPEWTDAGLGATLREIPGFAAYAGKHMGLHRVPTLRNVDKRPSSGFVKAYGHNGYFKSLEEVVHFYNTRDVLPAAGETDDPKPGINCWPEPEVAENVNRAELGNLGLNHEEEAALVAFLRTLSDGYGSDQGP